MLRLVSACEDLQPAPEDEDVRVRHGPGGVRGGVRGNNDDGDKVNGTSRMKDLSIFAIFRGIVPGKMTSLAGIKSWLLSAL